jgi:acyl-CoA synthetase (AMP-forming)/AMP-acid ligase II
MMGAMKTVRELIDTAAAGSGDRTFMLTPDAAETLSFTALRERAHDIARSLIALRPHGNKVALAVGRGRPTIELILGALYGGVVPVPLNPTTAAGQLGHVLNHCGAGIVIASRENAELVRSAATLSRWPGQVIRVEDLDPLDRAGAEESVKPPREDDQAILVYTSGTTARPKGVAHTHRGRVVGAEAVAARLGLGAEDRMLCVLPFYHLNAINAAIVALASGASIVVCPQFEPDSFWSQAARTGCSWS